jgi:catechol 2,3-dioxygenase-like lactoylglutathione lyase family enzyme
MTINRLVPILRVTDMAAAIDFYTGLGFVVEFRYAAGSHGPWYAGISIDGHQVHLSTFGGDSARGAAVYFYVDDVDVLYERFKAGGLKTPGKADSPVEEAPVEQSWRMREFYVCDPDGNALRFGSPSR